MAELGEYRQCFRLQESGQTQAVNGLTAFPPILARVLQQLLESSTSARAVRPKEDNPCAPPPKSRRSAHEKQPADGRNFFDRDERYRPFDKSRWDVVDHYALFLYKATKANQTDLQGVFFKLTLSDQAYYARMWMPIKHVEYDHSASRWSRNLVGRRLTEGTLFTTLPVRTPPRHPATPPSNSTADTPCNRARQDRGCVEETSSRGAPDHKQCAPLPYDGGLGK